MSLIDIVADEENLMEAFNKAKKGCDWKRSVQDFDMKSLEEITKLHNQLIDGTYRPLPYFEFILNERGKVRHIKACHIRDRIVQKSLCEQVLNPILTKYLIYDNGASLAGKGIDFCRRRLEYHLNDYYKVNKTNVGYVLLIDFSKFFDSIPHDKLLQSVEEKLSDNSLNWLLDILVNSFGEEKGLGIGSQISQIFGLFYPTKIDTYCKVVKGLKYYARYMDDIYIIHKEKKVLENVLNEILKFAEELGLTINLKKTRINRIDKQFVFLKTKYTLLNNGFVLKKIHEDCIIRERRRLKKYAKSTLPYETIRDAYASWYGNVIKNYHSKKKIKELNKLYDDLFIATFIDGSYREREDKVVRERRGLII